MSNKKDETLVEILKKKDTTRQSIDTTIGSVRSTKQIMLKDFEFYHIQELTFEEKLPRKEALENVLASLMVEGIRFVYLLIGDKDKVSFYFGIAKDKNFKKELELDIDDIGEQILKANIEANFRGSKIVKHSNKKEILNILQNMKRIASIDGVPSVNEDNEDFQGVDRLADVMLGDEFCLMVIADPFEMEEVQELEDNLYNIHDKLAPLANISIQENEGISKTEGESKGKSSSSTTGENKGHSLTDTKGTNKGISESKGSSDSSSNYSNTASDGSSESISRGINEGTNNSKTEGSSENYTKSIAKNSATTKSREFTIKVINEWIEYIDEFLLTRVEYGRNKGLFHTGMYLLSNEKGTLIKLGNTIRSLFSGENNNKAPLKIRYLTNPQEIKAVQNIQIPYSRFDITENLKQARLLFSKSDSKLSNWFSTNELTVIAGLPKKDIVGLALKEEVEFGLNIDNNKTKDSNKLLLGHLIKSGRKLNIEISIDRNSLNKHTFITGVTGSGKTTTCQRVLDSANMPFMVIEPAKTEYRVLTKKYKDILIFTLGNERIAPFRINPFEFFEGESITSRVDMIKATIEAAFDMEAAIPQIIESALYECYKEYGWDIATSTNSRYENPFADGIYAFPTLSDLIRKTTEVVKTQGFDDRLKNDYIGSIRARLQGLMVGAKGFMLNTPRSINFKDLVEKNIIIELEEIKNGAEKSLIMGFILINLNEAIKQKYKEYKVQNKEFKHITLIEEAHRLLSKYMPGDNPSKKLGVETFTDMLAEVRKYGESLIIVDQIPDKLTPEVLKNTNTKIVHRLFATDDKNAIGNTMALKDEQKEFLSSLEVGRAILFNQNLSKPIQVQIKELDGISTTKAKPIDEKEIRDIALSYYQVNYKRGIIQGIECYKNTPSIKEIEEFLSLKFNGLVQGWESFCKGGYADTNCFDICKYLEDNQLMNKKDIIVFYLTNRCYPLKSSKEKVIIQDLIYGLINGNEYSRKEKAYLRIK